MFDIILVFTISRNHSYYINIVKSLSPKCSIGIYLGLFSANTRNKTAVTDQLFLYKCEEFGATILEEKEEYACDILLVTQNSMSEERSNYLMNHISCDNIIIVQVMDQGYGSLKTAKEFGINKLWVFYRKGLVAKLKDEKQEDIMEEFDITDIELPYSKYPAMELSDIELDYLIAYPSQTFFENKRNEVNLFCNMKKLLKSIPNNKNIYVKLHNVTDKGNRYNKSSFQSKYFSIVDYVLLIIKMVVKKILGRNVQWADDFYTLRIMKAKEFIEKRSIPLSEVTEYHNMNIEHFLPFVKEGLLASTSLVILHALKESVPVYNCDDQLISKDLPNYEIYKDFLVPSCRGELNFNPTYYANVNSKNERYDMVKLIKREIGQV